MIKKINLILCILIALVFIGQTVLMCMPYFNYTPKLTKYQKEVEGLVETPQDYSLLQFVWTDYYNMQEYLINNLVEAGKIEKGTAQKQEDQLGEQSNGYVLGLVGVTVLGMVVLIMTIFTRKSLVQYIFSLAWAACSIFAFFADNYILHNIGTEYGLGTILPICQILSVIGAVLVLLRAYPWIYSRFIYKKPIDLASVNA